MATVALRKFTNPDTLKHIGDRYLIELLSPHRTFFAARGLTLPPQPSLGIQPSSPAPASEEQVDCEKLADIFMKPDTDMPQELAETLFSIHEMSTKEAMDQLQEAADEHGLELGLPTDADPADVAVRV